MHNFFLVAGYINELVQTNGRYTVKKRGAKSKKFCKILQTLKTPTALIKQLATVFKQCCELQ